MIKDLKPGRLIASTPEEAAWVVFSYNHMLPRKLYEQGYRIRVKSIFAGNETIVIARISFKNKKAGDVSIFHSPGSRYGNMDMSEIYPKHRGKGLGTAAYEALFAHMYHKMGIRYVRGERHSSSAARTHQKLAKKHGLKYPFAGFCIGNGAAFDGLYAKYEYPLE